MSSSPVLCVAALALAFGGGGLLPTPTYDLQILGVGERPTVRRVSDDPLSIAQARSKQPFMGIGGV
jgi:hypothetical protein